MSAITRMLNEMSTIYPLELLSKEEKSMLKWIKEYAEKKERQYKENKDSGKITFGKYKGQTVEAVAGLDKGIDYLVWVSRQTWMSSEKFPTLFDQIEKALKKK